MSQTTPVQHESQSPFWSFRTILFAGFILILLNPLGAVIVSLVFICINFWKMRATKKLAIYFVGAMVGLTLIEWLSWRNWAYFMLENKWHTPLFIAYLVAPALVIAVAANLAQKDVSEFENKELQAPGSPWWAGPLLTVAMLCGYAGALSGLELAYKWAGQCRREHLTDMIFEMTRPERVGVETIFLERADFGCEWRWSSEYLYPDWSKPDETKEPLEVNSLIFRGEFGEYDFAMTQTSTRYEEVTTEIFNSHQYTLGDDIKRVDVDVTNAPGASFESILCSVSSGGLKSCTVLLGYEHVLYEFFFMGSGFDAKTNIVPAPDEILEKIINDAIIKADEKIVKYESTLQ